jgi:transcriptional regulator with XRE-family HTH domain
MNSPLSSVDECVGERVRVARELWNLDRVHLADALGVSIEQIERYENGHERVGAVRLLQLSRFFDVASSFFFVGWRASGHLVTAPAIRN